MAAFRFRQRSGRDRIEPRQCRLMQIAGVCLDYEAAEIALTLEPGLPHNGLASRVSTTKRPRSH